MMEYVVVYPYFVESWTYRLPLVLKKKPDYLKGMLNLPGGKLNHGETPVDAAVRELLEETGLEQIQDYDPMCYCPADYLGFIQGKNSIIHCVRVPVSERQELKPGVSEEEEIKWYKMPGLLNIPNLMPNLRIIIPLMDRNVQNWRIEDFDDGWREKSHHVVSLFFKGMEENPVKIKVNAVGYYTWEEEE